MKKNPGPRYGLPVGAQMKKLQKKDFISMKKYELILFFSKTQQFNCKDSWPNERNLHRTQKELVLNLRGIEQMNCTQMG
jgi:hypothetical protein